MTTEYETLVPLEQMGLERMTALELAAYAQLANVEIRLDFLDRPSITLEAAYKIAEQRRRAEKEYVAAESVRRGEHAKAVKDLQTRVNETFMEARTAALAASVGANLWGGQVERDGTAVNAGLSAARAVWATAGPAVRDEVRSVEFTEDGTITSVPLNVDMPLELLSAYAAKAARKY